MCIGVGGVGGVLKLVKETVLVDPGGTLRTSSLRNHPLDVVHWKQALTG